ncbi:MAG: hypothetical protein KGQ59_03015 [Bdellovibrionales bacterium]|nr:hypothetical protein [Bdellovibrionales bacterium]
MPRRLIKLPHGLTDPTGMDSDRKYHSDEELDWASLVQEMDGIKERVEQSLESSIKESMPQYPGKRSVAYEDQSSIEEVLSGLGSGDDSQDTQAQARVIPLEQRPSAQRSPGNGESTLSLAVIGALKLRLELTRQSQTVQIHLEESQLRVELSDGSEFRIPLNKAA